MQHLEQVGPIVRVESFRDVQLEEEPGSVPAVEILDEALDIHEIVMDAILANESTLTLGDDPQEDQSKPICQNLQEDLRQWIRLIDLQIYTGRVWPFG